MLVGLVNLALFSFVLYVIIFAMIKRLRDIGWNPWLTLVGFIPWINFVFFLVLCFMKVPEQSSATN